MENIGNAENGLFNLDEFINYPIDVVSKYFVNKGWEEIQPFNDYRRIWNNEKLNKSIIVATQLDEDRNEEIVVHISWNEGENKGQSADEFLNYFKNLGKELKAAEEQLKKGKK